MHSYSNQRSKDNPKQSNKHIEQIVNQDNLHLANQLKKLRAIHKQKQLQLLSMNKQFKIEYIKNKKMKEQLLENQRNVEEFKKKYILKLLNECNKQSPLFYNENGLCPFEMMLLQQSRYEPMENNICMICYADLQANARIIKLPCTHFFHKQCGVQRLLYSHHCPACDQIVKIQLNQ